MRQMSKRESHRIPPPLISLPTPIWNKECRDNIRKAMHVPRLLLDHRPPSAHPTVDGETIAGSRKVPTEYRR